ncbi:hypothetical protein L2E82_48404 [Cichorium intybus]|uniref:Uncharacterized protein n=1 Tax=Cichorium intybus TaxID=13427 RepID=A0ACB8YY43_CICIN|nr:hypothetical protein L2E82_48404 [Cichorium intybus]
MAFGSYQKESKAGEEESKKEKLVTATKKGSAVLDQYISDQDKSQYHVLPQGNDIYDATLNQTNVGENNNKFYIIQALESDDGSRFMVYNRWGRVKISCMVTRHAYNHRWMSLNRSSMPRLRTVGLSIKTLCLTQSLILGWKWTADQWKRPW